MKQKTSTYWLAIIILCATASQTISSQTIASYDFESGVQGWTNNGNDAGLNTNSIFSCNGSQSIFSKDDDTSRNYITSPSLNLSSYSSIDFSFCFIGDGLDSTANEGFILQYYNGLSWSNLKTYQIGTDFASNNVKYEFYVTLSGTLPAYAQFRFTGTANSDSEYNYFDDVLIKASAAEIDIQGNSVTINDGDITPSNSDYTAFGTANEGTQIIRTYTINNKGGANLTISSICLSNTTDFSIIAPFYSSPVLPSTGVTTFTIQFNAATLGTKTCTVTVTNNDSGEGIYEFDIDARSEQNFFDSDGDGVLDNMDIDDDNDGILDSDEELACQNSSTSQTTNYKFLNETFGEGNRTTINTTYNAETTYCYEDGTVGVNTTECPKQSGQDLNDGKYTVYYKAADGDMINDTPVEEVASWADQYWYTGEDHTAGDTNGRMAMFNASYDPGIFYTATIIGALPNVPVTYSFWVLNLDTTTAPGIASRLRPNILVEFRDVNNNVLASIPTGDIDPSINGDPANSWHQFTANLTFSVSEFYVYFINNEVGGSGNDLAIDDIAISQTLCDSDKDGVADVFDLDSDNDGIPDVIEGGLGNYSNGSATLTGYAGWTDTNTNGMHDAFETHTAINSDGDSTPDYLDLDSDNDSIFDVDESGAGNSADLNYQNGDGDITGDGVGDGTDTDTVRETDIDSDGTIEYYTDGILDLYDFFNGVTMATAYGNSNQGYTGTGWGYYVIDTDDDGTPDYLDVTSDGSTYDISHTLYASLDGVIDGFSNGVIDDDTNDAEQDGIVDLFDTDDTVFGSPRDLDQKLHLYFDGRNDYADETTVINLWNEATIMAWIKLDPSSSGIQVISGQDEFYLQLNANKTITAYADDYNITSSTHLTTNQWYHVAATFSCDSCTSSEFNLYVNGAEEASTPTSSGGLNADTSSFTIGRQPGTDNNYFHGYMDEVRVFDKALTENELQKMVYQEIKDNTGIVRGEIIPKDIDDYVLATEISTPLNWLRLIRYYKLDTYKDDIIDDLTTISVDIGSGCHIYNTKIIDLQTAPLPFITQASGSLPTSVNISANGINGNDAITYDWSIVKIEHSNMIYNGNLKHLGLIIDEKDSSMTPITFQITNNSELNVSWYLKLDGEIDLEDESQLIQGAESTLDVTSKGTIERDQQGTADLYTYNYWSSPVGLINSSANNMSYKVTNVFSNVTFLTSGYNGLISPVSIADYWIWKYSNITSNTYALWQHVRSTGNLDVGEGFTMKGVTDTGGDISQTQNYIFNGKPNNGTITLPFSNNNDYLIGNPYPSAIDADEFILDNISDGLGRATSNIIDGTLYFWEHFASSTHYLGEYEGGYGMYTLTGSTAPITSEILINTSGSLVSTKGAPGQHIPVGQGFFVVAEDPDPSGNIITFKNSQRIFVKETTSTSTFIKQSNSKSNNTNTTIDDRAKIKLIFDSPKGYHRQLLAGVDPNATYGLDIGYDAKLIEDNIEDMFWTLNNSKYIIQGVNNFDIGQTMPLGVKISQQGIASIKIDELLNIESTQNIFLHDKTLNIHHDLKQSDYEVYLTVGEHLYRFEIVFSSPSSLDVENLNQSILEVYSSNESDKIIIHNPNSKFIKSVQLFNVLGQSIFKQKTGNNDDYIEYKSTQLNSGAYILKAETESGTITKKVLIK